MKIRGKNVNLYVYIGGTPTAAVCATNVSIRETAGTLSTLTMGGGKTRTYKPTVKDATITLDGVRTLGETGFEADDFRAGDELHIIIIYTDDSGDSLSYDMNVVVTETSDSNPVDSFSTYSISMVRSGPWTKLKTVTGGGGIHYLADMNGDYIYDMNGDLIIVP
jgi:hypothetical protein